VPITSCPGITGSCGVCHTELDENLACRGDRLIDLDEFQRLRIFVQAGG
jgi:hypothetical protein